MPSSPDPRDAPRPDAAAAPDPAPLRPPAQEVVGMSLALTDYERTMDWMDAVVAAREKAMVTAAAVHLVMVAREDPATRAALDDPRVLAVPDGQPLVWALKALGQPDASRVYGPDLMARYLERSTATGVRHYLYGGTNQGALVQLVNELRRRYPGLQIVGGYSPPFRELTADEEAFVVDDIHRTNADVVWVGTGQPKQEQWMAAYRDRLDAPVLVGVGAAFDFHAGLKSQAPAWMQDSGLEWAYRLAQEPRRLWKRYLLYNPLFIGAFARQWARQRRR